MAFAAVSGALDTGPHELIGQDSFFLSMHILLSTDNRYVMPTGVLMYSIGQNNENNVEYHIVTDGTFLPENRVALQTVANQSGCRCHFYVVDAGAIGQLPFGRENMPYHVTLATYYRLFITQFLPSNLHRIIYLDGDMIVRHSLLPLWEMPLEGCAIGAVHDMDEGVHVARLEEWHLTAYFNAGMLLIDLDWWRSHDSLAMFENFIGQHAAQIVFHDQDVLNGVFHDCVRWLPLTYNMQNGFLLAAPHKRYDVCLQSEIETCKCDPAIIHYTVHFKPWNIACFHPYRDEWRKYQRQTQWKNFRYEAPQPQKWIHYVRNWLFRYTSYVPKYDRTEYEKGLILADN